MPLVPAKCPECGGNVVVDSEKDAWICDFCKTPFIVDKAINNFNTINNVTNNITNNNEIKADIVNVYENKNSDFVIKAGELIEYNGASMDVVIPAGVSVIGVQAFTGSNIKSITIHNQVEKIYSFDNCINLEEVNLPEKLGGSLPIFSGCKSLKKINIPIGIDEIPEKAFFGCSSLKKIDIPKGVKKIGGAAFTNCSNLEQILLPDSIESIDCHYAHGTFEGCTSLKEIRLPDVVDYISENMFFNCTALERVYADHVKYIGEGSFRNCISMRQLPDFPELKSVGRHSSDNDSKGAFQGCQSLESIKLKGNIVWCENTFFNCTNLKKVMIEGVMINMPHNFFAGCNKIENMNLENIKSISATALTQDTCDRLNIEEYFIPIEIKKNINGDIYSGKWKNREMLKNDQMLEEQKRLETGQIASEIFSKRMKKYVERQTGDRKKCPICERYTLNWFGVCKNRNCVSYSMSADETINKMAARVSRGNCPYCGSRLALLRVSINENGEQSLNMECDANKLSCNLLFLSGWKDREHNR